ncbi:MAG TPA: DUF1552 domain-containing protein [Polyangiaceae bacterium]|nr:DUF1552 domain-containing protein [Polyangiaceae bacterium]
MNDPKVGPHSVRVSGGGLLAAKDQRDRRRLARRVFLSALGLGLSVPLASTSARLALAQTAARPRRLFIYYLPHGAPIEHCDPANAEGVLGPLAPYMAQVSALRGVGMNGASNHAAIRTMLTGNPDGSGSDSIDGLVASQLGVTPHVLGTVPYAKGSGFTSDSFLVKHGSWVRPEEDPARAADTLFQSLGTGAGVPNDANEFRSAALGLTEKELTRLQAVTKELTDEQSKLQIHLDAVRRLKAGGGGSMVVSCDKRPDLPAVSALAGADVLDPSQLGKVLDAHLEVAAHALVCGTASVVTLQNMYVNADLNMGFAGGPGVPKGHHEPISHSWDAAGRAEFAMVQRWFYARLAEKLLVTLNQTDPQDPEHTVLDNSIVAIMSEVSDGANHNSDASPVWLDGKETPTSLPLVLIGGGGGYLRPAGGIAKVSALHTDLLATLAEAMGAPQASMGGVPMKPITELKA